MRQRTADVADVDQLMATIEDLVALAPRATGTPGGEQAAAYVVDRFRRAGLDEVWVEESDSFAWEALSTALSVDGDEVACAAIRHCALTGHEQVGPLGTGPTASRPSSWTSAPTASATTTSPAGSCSST